MGYSETKKKVLQFTEVKVSTWPGSKTTYQGDYGDRKDAILMPCRCSMNQGTEF